MAHDDTRPDPSPVPSDAGHEIGATPFRGYLLALLVLLGSVVFVIWFWQNAQERELRAAQADFVADTQEMAAALQQRMVNYELALGGGAALFATVRPTPVQWQSFVEGLDIEQRFPGMLGIGFAAYVTPQGLQSLQLESRESGHGLLTLRPAGVRRYYGPILYLSPATMENTAVIGYDMYSDPTRRAAMAAARDSGKAQLTGPVALLQDRYSADVSARQPGLLLYSPIYRLGDFPSTTDARRQSMQGWVYMPFHVSLLVQAVMPNRERKGGVRFALHDATGTGTPQLLYADAGFDDSSPSAFSNSVNLDIYGRRWRLDFSSGPTDAVAPGLARLRMTLAIGLLASLLLFGLVMLLARTETRARQIALLLTEDYRRSEQRFRSAMEYSAIGKALLDREGRIVGANPALCGIVGRETSGLVGMAFSEFFDSADPVSSNEMEAIAEGVFRVTRRLRHNDGELRYAQLTYAPVPGNVGQDIARLVQVEDVTERLQTEAQVRNLNRTLEARVEQRTRELSNANNELESFAYSISHDLRTPLRSIDGFSKLLTERYQGVLDDAGRDYLSRVRNATLRMGELIEALLKMSRLSRGELDPQPLDLSQLASEVVAELRATDPGRHVDVVIAPGMRAIGDPALVRNLLGNLLGNAWKFTRASKHARVEFLVEGERDATETPTFVVRDNGVGFESEYVGKLFRPFQRLHSLEQFAGHGIGLASVKRIIQRHGGTIQAEGEVGKGATFRFTLPDPPATA